MSHSKKLHASGEDYLEFLVQHLTQSHRFFKLERGLDRELLRHKHAGILSLRFIPFTFPNNTSQGKCIFALTCVV